MHSCGMLWWRRRPDLVHRRLASASAPPLILVKMVLEVAERGIGEGRQRRARVRVVGAVGGVEEREGLAPARARRRVVGAQAAVDDAALVPHAVLHVAQRRRRCGWPPPARLGHRCWLRGGPARSDDRRRRPLVAVPGAGGGRGEQVAVVARGAEAGAPLRVEGPPPRLVRQARVRLHANRDQINHTPLMEGCSGKQD